jgi:lipopolysaccharide transport system ATP-binding protein
MKSEKIVKDQTVKIEWVMDFPLSTGTYSFSVGVANRGFNIGSFKEYLLLIHDIYLLNVLSRKDGSIYAGIFNMKPNIFIYQ